MMTYEVRLRYLGVMFIVVFVAGGVYSENAVASGLQGRRSRPVGTSAIKFTQSVFKANVLEDQPIGSTVFKVPVVTRHPDVVFSIKQNKKAGNRPPFAIDAQTGVIITTGLLKNLPTSKYTVVVHAKLKKPIRNEISARVIVRIISLPKFPAKGFHGYIKENIVGNVNQTVFAKCSTEKLQKSVRYSIIDVQPTEHEEYFHISKLYGVIDALHPLDYEKINRYELTIRAKSGQLYSQTTYIVHVIDENDQVPKFSFDILHINITENQEIIDHPLSHLHADIANDILGSQSVEYSINKGGKDVIGIDSKTGQLFNKQTIDFEHYSRFNLIVRAHRGELFSQARVVVQIHDTNDNKPTLPDFHAFVNYFQGKSGWTGFWIPAKDSDADDILKYKVIEGGKTDDGKDLVTVASNGLARLGKSEVALLINRTISTTMYISVTDGVHTVKSHCTIELSMITDEMASHSFKLRLFDVTPEGMLTIPGVDRFKKAIAELFKVNPANVYVFDIEAVRGTDDTYATVAVKGNDGKFFSLDSTKTSLYLSAGQLESRLGFRIEQVHEDECVTRQCYNHKVCALRHTAYDTSMLFSERRDVVYAGLFMSDETECVCPFGYDGVNCSEQINLCLVSNPCLNGGKCSTTDGGELVCDCPPFFAGETCEQNNTVCQRDVCKNNGQCIVQKDNTFKCVCKAGYDGVHCELTSRHFTGDSYLAFPSLQSRKSLNITFSLQTAHKDGMLLYIGRYNHRRDFIALEIVDSNLVLSFSFGRMTMRVLAGTAWGINDQEWHTISMMYQKKIVEVVVDNCRANANDLKVSNVPCKATAVQSMKVNWFLDVTSPLMIGGMPNKDKDERVLTNGFLGCMQNVYIDGIVLDLATNIMDKNTVAGCNTIGLLR